MMVCLRILPTMCRRSAFTLIELLVVIAVIMILAALVMPAMMKAVSMSERVRCGSNLGQINRGLLIYANHYNRFFVTFRVDPNGTHHHPPGCSDDNLKPLVDEGYVPDIKVFACPSTEDNPQTSDDLRRKRTEGGKGSYEYCGEHKPGLRYPDANTTICVVAFDEDGNGLNCYIDKDNHGSSGHNVLFLDGHVQWVKAQDWWPGPTAVGQRSEDEWTRVKR